MIDKQILRDQLNGQADAVTAMSGSELSESLLDTASVLVELAVSDKDIEFDETYENMYPLINTIMAFLRNSSSASEAEAQKQKLDEIVSRLDSAKGESGGLEEDIAKAEKENEALQSKIDELKKTFSSAIERGKELENSIRHFEEEIGKYPPDIITNLENEKKTAIENLSVISQNAAKLEEEKKKNVELQKAIDSFPDDLRQVVEQFEQQERRLDNLKNAAEKCSPEKLEELRRQVEEAEAINNDYTSKSNALQMQLSNLNESNIRIDEENEGFAEDVIKVLTASVEKMRSLSEGRAEYLDSLKRTIDDVSSQIEECRNIHKKYNGWLSADEVSANAMINQASGNDNNSSLKHVFTLSSQEEITRLIRNTKDSLADISVQLKKIDTILSDNVEAIAADENQKKHNAENI